MDSKPTYLILKGGLLITLFVILTTQISCSKQSVLAKVNDHELLRSEAEFIMEEMGYNPKSPEDVKTFVDTWVEAQLLTDELIQSNHEQVELAVYRTSMFKGEISEFYLVQELLDQKMDTSVSESEMLTYYKNNLKEFELNDFIVKALYIKVQNSSDKISALKRLYLLKKDKDLQQVESIAKLYAEDFYFDNQNWVFADDILKRIPVRSLNKESLVLNRTKTYLSDEKFTYFLNVLDVKLKNDPPPFEFVKDQIRNRILNQREGDLRKSIKVDLLKQLKENHDIEVHL